MPVFQFLNAYVVFMMLIGHTGMKGKASGKKSVIALKWQITNRPCSEGYFDFVSKRTLMDYQASAEIFERNQKVAR